jgi:hypothetical protein
MKVPSQSKEILEQLDSISYHQESVERLRSIAPEILGDFVLEKATNLYAEFAKFLAASLSHLAHHYATNVARSAIGDEVADCKKSLGDALKAFNDAVTQEINLLILREKTEQQIEDALSRFSTLPLDFKAKQDDLWSRAVSGTGTWLLNSQNFQNWRDGASSSLWFSGLRKCYHSRLHTSDCTKILPSWSWKDLHCVSFPSYRLRYAELVCTVEADTNSVPQ